MGTPTAAVTRCVRLGWAALTPGDVLGMWACEFSALRSADVVVERLYKVRSGQGTLTATLCTISACARTIFDPRELTTTPPTLLTQGLS